MTEPQQRAPLQDRLREAIESCVEHGFTEDLMDEHAQPVYSGEILLREARHALLKLGTDAHGELLAIHQAAMDPQAAMVTDADTLTLRLVKEFIQAALKAQAEVEVKQDQLAHLGRLLQEQTYTAAVIKILSDEALTRARGSSGRSDQPLKNDEGQDAVVPNAGSGHHNGAKLAPSPASAEPDANGWITWAGGSCPEGYNTVVDVRWRSDVQHSRVKAGNWIWRHSNEDDDIVAYRVSRG